MRLDLPRMSIVCALTFVVLSFLVGLPNAIGAEPSDNAATSLTAFAAKGHPRLMLDAHQIEAWRLDTSAARQQIRQRLMKDVDGLKQTTIPARRTLGRGEGNRLAELAVMARLSGDAELLEVAKRYLLDIAKLEVWDPDTDLLHGHLLWGAAIAYDWLWSDLDDAQRTAVREKLAHEAQLQYEASTIKRGYWRHQYLQNHGHVNFCGLAFAAAALASEDDRASAWWTLADGFFRETFAWSNPDGVSIEGLSYGVYALEFCLRYAELVRQVEGVNYFATPWFANMPLFVLHSTLPVMNKNTWAMDFGDSPRNGNSHLATHSMAKIAAELRDPVAQGAGQMLQDLQGILGHDAWQTALWYDATVPAANRSQMPTFHHFADTGQVMMRTDWSQQATLVGLRCGPWQGHNAWRRAAVDLGAAHAHPDINSFQLFANGAWLLIDPGYTYMKRTSDHSTLLVDGHGQLGGDVTWFAAEDATAYDHYARIVRADTCEQYDYVMGDGTFAYHPGLGLKRFVRHWLLLKPAGTLVIVDDLAAEPTGYYKAWTRQMVQFEGMKIEDAKREFLVPATEDRKGRVFFAHDGPSGTYDIDVDYFDNAPGKGHYVLAVGDKVVADWLHDVQETDLHVRTVRKVRIEKGDTIELRGQPFGVPGKFIKMVVSNRSIPRDKPHRMELSLHADPAAKVQRVSPPDDSAGASHYVVDTGKACLDIQAMAAGLESRSETYDVVQGSSIKRTQRIVLQPKLSPGKNEDTAVLVTVLQPCQPQDKAALHAEAKSDPQDRSVTIRLTDPTTRWDARIRLEDGRLRVQRQSPPAED